VNYRCLYDKLVDPKKLKPHPKNRNSHPPDQIDRLAKIIEYQGWRYPVKVSKRSGFVTAGHGRIEAAKILKCKVPVNEQDYESDEQEYADVQSDNAIALWAELDFSGINADIADLGPEFDIELLGIKNFEIDVADKDPGCDEDEVPDVKEPISKPGDLYVLGGRHRLLCGDSTNIQHVELLMDGQRADMVFTDPPYNHASEEKLVGQSVSRSMKKLSESEWDKGFSFLDVAGSIESAMAENSTVYVCTSWHLAGEIWKWMKERSNYNGYCVWHKPNPMPSLMKRHWTWSTELICYATYGKHVFNFPNEGHASNLWAINKNQKNDLHPTMKPIGVPENAILHSSNTGQSVLDLFGGSGSTLIACEKTNRNCFMMELDPHYIDVIVSRYARYTKNNKIILNGQEILWDAHEK